MAAYTSRYAHAFLDVVTSAHLDTAATQSQFDDFIATWNDSSELRDFLMNPAVAAPQKVAFLDTLNKKLKLGKELRNLIAIMINNGRIGDVVEVAAAYRTLLQKQLGIQQAEIVTARELAADERNVLVAQVSKIAGTKIDATFRLDAAILGGTVVRIGSTVYDGSVRGRLDRLKDQLVSD